MPTADHPHYTAVVGTGFIGPVHIEALRRLGRPVLAVVGSTPDRGREMAERLNVTRSYDTYEDMLADPMISAVHLATPNRLHYTQVRQALDAGKHVLCEKPLGMTSAETRHLVELAALRPSQTCGVAYNVRFYPLNLEARRRVLDGSLGKVYHVSGSYQQDWLLHDTDFNWRVLSSESGPLRAVADIGTHWLDLVQFVTGLRVVSVCAEFDDLLPVRRRPASGSVETFSSGADVERTPIDIDTEDFAAILLKFDNGGTGTFHVSQVAAGRKNECRYEVAGSRGSLAWNGESPNVLWLGRRDGPNEVLTRDPSLLSAEARGYADYPGGHNEGFPDSFKQLFRSFYRAAGGGANDGLFPTFADGHREVALCEAILTSHRERRWVEVSP